MVHRSLSYWNALTGQGPWQKVVLYGRETWSHMVNQFLWSPTSSPLKEFGKCVNWLLVGRGSIQVSTHLLTIDPNFLGHASTLRILLTQVDKKIHHQLMARYPTERIWHQVEMYAGKNIQIEVICASLRIQICPKKGINPTILLWGWDWDHQTYSLTIPKNPDPSLI